jgi:hypothetical protein
VRLTLMHALSAAVGQPNYLAAISDAQ